MRVEINERNQYVIGKHVCDRVTEIIGATVGARERDEWKRRLGAEAERISREAAEWGTLVHELLMLNDRGKWREVDKMLTSTPSLLPPFLAWREWVATTIKKWVLIEEVVYSLKLRIAGRVDRVAYIEGDEYPSIVDIKTGELWESTGIQVWGAYKELYNEKKKGKKRVMRGIAVQLPRKEPGILRVKDYTKDKYIVAWEDAKRDYFNARGREI